MRLLYPTPFCMLHLPRRYNAVEAINIDSFLTVPASQALYTPQDDSQVYRALGKQKAVMRMQNYSYFIQGICLEF